MKLTDKLFSIINIKGEHGMWYKVITLCGLSFKIRNNKKEFYETNKKNEHLIDSLSDMTDFLNTETKENSVLLIEFNNCHYEVIPSYAKYLSELGFNVDVVVQNTKYSADTLSYIKRYGFNKKLFNLLLSSKKFTQYKYIFTSSQILYEKIGSFEINKEKEDTNYRSMFEHFPVLNQYREKLYTVEHHLDLVDKDLLKRGHVISLANMPILKDKTIVANPHYFGEINITPKNDDKTIFITVGALESFRRNTNLLIDTVAKLVKNNITNFEVLVVGRGSIENIPKNIRKYIKILGRLSSYEMYKNIDKSDFFLPLLDPENVEHDRYIYSGTSGSFQLIYGFAKPCLIAEKFADLHSFSNNNSIVYKNNEDLYDAMKMAIEMDKISYSDKQEQLAELKNNLYSESLNNLKKTLIRNS